MPMRPCVCTYFTLKNENRFHLSRQSCSSHSFDCTLYDVLELRFHRLSFMVSLVLRRDIILRLPACNEVEVSVKIRRDRQRQLCLIALRFPHWVLDVSMPDAGCRRTARWEEAEPGMLRRRAGGGANRRRGGAAAARPKVHGTEMKQPSHREALMIRSSAAPPSPSQRLTLSRRTAACPKQSTATAPTAWKLGLLVALWVRDPPAHFLPAPRSFLRRRL